VNTGKPSTPIIFRKSAPMNTGGNGFHVVNYGTYFFGLTDST